MTQRSPSVRFCFTPPRLISRARNESRTFSESPDGRHGRDRHHSRFGSGEKVSERLFGIPPGVTGATVFHFGGAARNAS
jgi:hypothetical protein